MAIYLKVVAVATIKIQDPYDDKAVEKAKENTCIVSPFEMTNESYEFTIEDAD